MDKYPLIRANVRTKGGKPVVAEFTTNGAPPVRAPSKVDLRKLLGFSMQIHAWFLDVLIREKDGKCSRFQTVLAGISLTLPIRKLVDEVISYR